MIDAHVHLFGRERDRTGCHLDLGRLAPLVRFSLLRRHPAWAAATVRPGIDDEIADRLLEQIEGSHLHHAVLLPLDAAHDHQGRPCAKRTVCRVTNAHALAVASRSSKTFAGASIHPYRDDALHELARVADQGACLIKWIPSTQGIDLADPRCLPFYDRLAALGLPLLCHVGVEHVLPGGTPAMNRPAALGHALERGVTVIAAHCGARLFITERDWLGEWLGMLARHPRLFGDVSAFGYPLRRLALARILTHPVAASRVLYGSDFPSPALPLSYLGVVPWRTLQRLRGEPNPFDRSATLLAAARLPTAAFTRAYGVLGGSVRDAFAITR